MKVLNVCLLLIVTLLMFRPVVAQNNAEPMTFSQFKEQKDLQINNGFYTVYRLGDKYYLEIPMEGMGKEVLITTQVVRGYSAFLSETSGVVRFSIGKNNRVQVVRNRVTDVAADSTDFCMANAIRKSGLVPVDFTLISDISNLFWESIVWKRSKASSAGSSVTVTRSPKYSLETINF